MLFLKYMHFQEEQWCRQPQNTTAEPQHSSLVGVCTPSQPSSRGAANSHPIAVLETELGMTRGRTFQEHFQPFNTWFVREMSSKSLPGKVHCACCLPRAANAKQSSPS